MMPHFMTMRSIGSVAAFSWITAASVLFVSQSVVQPVHAIVYPEREQEIQFAAPLMRDVDDAAIEHASRLTLAGKKGLALALGLAGSTAAGFRMVSDRGLIGYSGSGNYGAYDSPYPGFSDPWRSGLHGWLGPRPRALRLNEMPSQHAQNGSWFRSSSSRNGGYAELQRLRARYLQSESLNPQRSAATSTSAAPSLYIRGERYTAEPQVAAWAHPSAPIDDDYYYAYGQALESILGQPNWYEHHRLSGDQDLAAWATTSSSTTSTPPRQASEGYASRFSFFGRKNPMLKSGDGAEDCHHGRGAACTHGGKGGSASRLLYDGTLGQLMRGGTAILDTMASPGSRHRGSEDEDDATESDHEGHFAQGMSVDAGRGGWVDGASDVVAHSDDQRDLLRWHSSRAWKQQQQFRDDEVNRSHSSKQFPPQVDCRSVGHAVKQPDGAHHDQRDVSPPRQPSRDFPPSSYMTPQKQILKNGEHAFGRSQRPLELMTAMGEVPCVIIAHQRMTGH